MTASFHNSSGCVSVINSHQGRGAAHRRQHRQAARACCTGYADKRGVTRLQLHTALQSAQCPRRPQFQKYRRNGELQQRLNTFVPENGLPVLLRGNRVGCRNSVRTIDLRAVSTYPTV